MSSYQPRFNRGRQFARSSANAQKPAIAAAAKATVTGNPRLWVTLQTITDPATGAKKTTRVMEVPGGALVNTCTRSAHAMCEALAFVPGVGLAATGSGAGVRLVPLSSVSA